CILKKSVLEIEDSTFCLISDRLLFVEKLLKPEARGPRLLSLDDATPILWAGLGCWPMAAHGSPWLGRKPLLSRQVPLGSGNVSHTKAVGLAWAGLDHVRTAQTEVQAMLHAPRQTQDDVMLHLTSPASTSYTYFYHDF
ncbi:D-amino acid dehydrogenase, partial [Frankliniella fusca]